MPMLALLRSGRDPSPISLLATLLVLFGLFAMMRDRMSATSEVDQASEPCDEFYDPLCASELDGGSARRGGTHRRRRWAGGAGTVRGDRVLERRVLVRGVGAHRHGADPSMEGLPGDHRRAHSATGLLVVRRRAPASSRGHRGRSAVERSAFPDLRGRTGEPRVTLRGAVAPFTRRTSDRSGTDSVVSGGGLAGSHARARRPESLRDRHPRAASGSTHRSARDGPRSRHSHAQ